MSSPISKGISVHVGVNETKPEFDMGTLLGCVKDAEAMFELATNAGFEAIPPFLDETATSDNIEAAIKDAATRLGNGDIFLFTFAGHGSMSPTTILDDDGQNETILLRDCIWIDNYLRRNLWSEFAEGVRIVGIADSCHSGTVLLEQLLEPEVAPVATMAYQGAIGAMQAKVLRDDPPLVVRRVPQTVKGIRGFSEDDQERILARSPAIHATLRAKLRTGQQAQLKASLLTLAACSDFELARDGEDHGLFTQSLLDIWNNGEFDGDYDVLINQIRPMVIASNPAQHPTLRVDGTPAFRDQKPFTIAI